MGNMLVDNVRTQALRYGEREAYRFCWRKQGEWLSTSWNEMATQVDVVARALASAGIGPGDRIAICSPNTPQVFIAELGAFRNRAAAIPVYYSSSQDQFDYICSDGNARIIFIGDSNQYPLAYRYQKEHPEVLCVVIFKNEGCALEPDDRKSVFWDDFIWSGMHSSSSVAKEVDRRAAAGLPTDMATLIYTSGTTGEPKGVVITHGNYEAAIRYHLKRLDTLSDEDLSMSFLPMSHILEKAWCYFCMVRGIRIAVNYDPRNIQDTIHEVGPNVMCCVPRFWEKVYTGVKEKLESASGLKRIVVRRALRTGYKYNLEYLRFDRKPPVWLEKEYRFWEKRLFSRIKKRIGIPEPKMFPTAGAPLSDRICEFMHSIGINVVVGYGLSETTATVTCYPRYGYEIGTVGTPLQELEVKISGEGEILVKGDTVTPGYYNNPEANKEAFTRDGFFRTGDAGHFVKGGALVLTERIKDLFKTSNGKYIAPQALESRLAENRYIDEVAVIGENRKFVTALIVPNFPNLRKWAAAEGISEEDSRSLVKNPKVNRFLMDQIDSVQSRMPSYEQIKRICVLPHPFSIMNGEVTNTMKVRRPVVARRYASEIESMYKDN